MNKEDFFKYTQGAVFGVVAMTLLYVTTWVYRNQKAVINAIMYPEVVANLDIKTVYEVKK